MKSFSSTSGAKIKSKNFEIYVPDNKFFGFNINLIIISNKLPYIKEHTIHPKNKTNEPMKTMMDNDEMMTND